MITRRIVLDNPTEEVTIVPLGDFQWAGDRSDIAYDHLQAHLDEVLKMPHPLLIGMGDYIDFASPSNREALRSAKLYETARRVIADATTNLVNDLYDRLLAPTRGLWAGLLRGHHHHPARLMVPSGHPEAKEVWLDSDVYLAQLLETMYLEEFGIIKLRWPGGRPNAPYHGINIVAYHGAGSSVFPWGPLNRLYRISPHFNADILLMGHQTKKAVGEYDWINPVDDDVHGDRLDHRTRHLVGTGGWSRGYIEGRETYISQSALSPVALGQPFIHIRPAYRTSTTTGATVWEPRVRVES